MKVKIAYVMGDSFCLIFPNNNITFFMAKNQDIKYLYIIEYIEVCCYIVFFRKYCSKVPLLLYVEGRNSNKYLGNKISEIRPKSIRTEFGQRNAK